jgi:hypothetical protein
MTEAVWQLGPLAAAGDAQAIAGVRDCFEGLYRSHFGDDRQVNHDLPVEVRAFRRSEGWCVFLLLTPWMMARVYLPEHDPGLALPAGWSAAERATAPFVVIGPTLGFNMLGGEQKAHLNYLPELGHFLLQPLVQSMAAYVSADAVFEAWNDVINTRVRAMEQMKRECLFQREVSRREFFTGLGAR